ncbi:lef-2 [Adoxophyes orana granulovirus]|uniref:Lef-2 n=1 Tax=Adoxophyes orana granulovirus TaxID=170617 RepID=Q7T9Y3_GVAO|nr:lef-2 [Adoxophyes orana granulovirus]AAP85669.1 lef-2 [Adoxophyes orana granulovirus]
METYTPNTSICPEKMYKIDIFMRKWQGVNLCSEFVEGGRYFVMFGKNLKILISKSKTFEEHKTDKEKNRKRGKSNHCFLKYGNDRKELIKAYEKLMYQPSMKCNTKASFKNLCIRPRKNRYADRQKFSFFTLMRFKCNVCRDKCVHEALKIFYCRDDKCVKHVDDLVARL